MRVLLSSFPGSIRSPTVAAPEFRGAEFCASDWCLGLAEGRLPAQD